MKKYLKSRKSFGAAEVILNEAGGVEMGKYNIFEFGAGVSSFAPGQKLTIGEYNVFGIRVDLSVDEIGSYNEIQHGAKMSGPITIGDFVRVSAGVELVATEPLTIPDYSVVYMSNNEVQIVQERVKTNTKSLKKKREKMREMYNKKFR